jgi:hypothetical protein
MTFRSHGRCCLYSTRTGFLSKHRQITRAGSDLHLSLLLVRFLQRLDPKISRPADVHRGYRSFATQLRGMAANTLVT